MKGFAATTKLPMTSQKVSSVVKVTPRVPSPVINRRNISPSPSPKRGNSPSRNPFESPPLSPREKLKNILSPLKVRNPFAKSKNPFEEEEGENDGKNPFLNSDDEKNSFVESNGSKNPFTDNGDSKNPFVENDAPKNPFLDENGGSNPFLGESAGNLEESGHVFTRDPIRTSSTISDPMREQVRYIRECLEEAVKKGRVDEANMLRNNLKELKLAMNE